MLQIPAAFARDSEKIKLSTKFSFQGLFWLFGSLFYLKKPVFGIRWQFCKKQDYFGCGIIRSSLKNKRTPVFRKELYNAEYKQNPNR